MAEATRQQGQMCSRSREQRGPCQGGGTSCPRSHTNTWTLTFSLGPFCCCGDTPGSQASRRKHFKTTTEVPVLESLKINGGEIPSERCKRTRLGEDFKREECKLDPTGGKMSIVGVGVKDEACQCGCRSSRR